MSVAERSEREQVRPEDGQMNTKVTHKLTSNLFKKSVCCSMLMLVQSPPFAMVSSTSFARLCNVFVNLELYDRNRVQVVINLD